MSFFGELRRRNVVKVAAAYAIVGWLLIEVSSTVLPTFEAPEWVLQTITFVIVLGFPLALILSWAYELTPEGIKLERDVAAGESITHVTGRKIDFAIIGALVLALGFVVYNYVLVEENSESETVSDESVETPPPVVVEELPEVLPNSVAVLLCDNLSPNPDDAYFAAGIHEEILNQLVKLRNLNVIARTSVLQYAEAPPPIPQIAQELNVGAVMECSVRYAGDAIIVTAQLIDPETNSHLWSDTYPGDLSDLSTVFAMQADIAMNIANAVGAEFSVEEQESLEQLPTSSRAAYSLYLRALSTSFVDLESSITDLDQAIALDSQFALAYGYKATLLADRGRGRADVFTDWEIMATEAAERALELNSDLAMAHAALGGIHYANGRRREAQEAIELAYELSPDDLTVQLAYITLLWDAGRYEETLSLAQRVTELNPSGEYYGHHVVGLAHLSMHNYESAAAGFRRNLELNAGNFISQIQLSRTVAARGNQAAAVRELRIAEQLAGDTISPGRSVSLAALYRRSGRPDDAARLLNSLDQTTEALVPAAMWTDLHLASGEYDQAQLQLEVALTGDDLEPGVLNLIKANIYQDPVLEEPQWIELRNRIHALD